MFELHSLSDSLRAFGKEQLGEVLASKIDDLFTVVIGLARGEESIQAARFRGQLESGRALCLQSSQGLRESSLSNMLTLSILSFL